MDHLYNHAFHTLILGPALVYIGIVRDGVPDTVFNIMGAVALFLFAYHSYKAYTKLKAGQSAWVNWIHIFLIAPLFLLIAYMKKTADRRYFEMLMLLGFAAIGYHGLYLIRDSIIA